MAFYDQNYGKEVKKIANENENLKTEFLCVHLNKKIADRLNISSRKIIIFIQIEKKL